MSQNKQDKLNPERQMSEKNPLNDQELENAAGGYVIHLFHCPNCGWEEWLPGWACNCLECGAETEVLM